MGIMGLHPLQGHSCVRGSPYHKGVISSAQIRGSVFNSHGFVQIEGNQIHSTAVVGRHVRLGTGNVVGPGVVLAGPVTLGDDNWLGAHVVIGCPPEMRGHPHAVDWIDSGEGLGVRVGSRNVIREGAQVHAGLYEQTRLADDIFLMNQVYIAHDCQLSDGVTMASNVAVGGHVHVGARANLGLGTVVHQRRAIGGLAMVGMGSVVTRDLPAFVKAYGNPCKVHGVNTVGMDRAGIPADVVARVVGDVESESGSDWAGLPGLGQYLVADSVV
jgi:UDP-N-acetylglucosamine acyltransferase